MGVSDEPRATIEEKFIKKHKVTYTIISAPKAGQAYGVKSIPSHFTVDPHGKISTARPDSLLGDVDFPPPADYSKKFDKARAAVKAGDFKTASSELSKLSKPEGKEGEQATALQKWIDDHAGKVIAEGDKALGVGDVLGAKAAYDEVSKKWDPKAEAVKTAKEKLGELQKDKDAKKALAQEKLYAQAVALEDAGDKLNAAAAFEKCAKGAKDTKFAEWCEKKAKENK